MIIIIICKKEAEVSWSGEKPGKTINVSNLILLLFRRRVLFLGSSKKKRKGEEDLFVILVLRRDKKEEGNREEKGVREPAKDNCFVIEI